MLNGFEVMKEALVNKAVDFAGRPQDLMVNHVTEGPSGGGTSTTNNCSGDIYYLKMPSHIYTFVHTEVNKYLDGLCSKVQRAIYCFIY